MMIRWLIGVGACAAAMAVPQGASAADCQNPDCRPDVIPAEGRDIPPPGYRRETRRFQGPLIGGVTTAVAGGLMFGAGATASSGEGSPDLSTLLMIQGGVAAGVGLGLVAYAFLAREEVFVRDRQALSVAPLVSESAIGGALHVAF